MNLILYSVIIPTHNRAGIITSALDGLVRQTIDPKKYEIIIVDDGSIDSTKSVIEKYSASHKQWKIIYLAMPHAGPASARNTGIKNAKGDIVFFTDDDCVVPATWMERILDIFDSNKNIAGVGGWFRPPIKKLRENIYVQFHYLLHRFYYGFALDTFMGKYNDSVFDKNKNIQKKLLYPIIAANAAYRKKIIKKIGGFDERFPFPAYEDLDLNSRLIDSGYELYYSSSLVMDYRELDFKSFLQLCANRARSQYLYKSYRLKENNNFIEYPWKRVSQFSSFITKNKENISGDFKISNRHVLLAMLWFFYGYIVTLHSAFQNLSFFTLDNGHSN